MLSRRSFMRSGTLTALSLGLAVKTGPLAFGQHRKQTDPALDFTITDRLGQEPLIYYTQAAFENVLGSTFQTLGARGTVDLTLVKVTGYKPNQNTRITTGKARETDSFSLLFKASGPLPAFAPIHTLSHPVLGKIDLFMTERKTESGEIFYEAVINHLSVTTGPSGHPKRGPGRVMRPE